MVVEVTGEAHIVRTSVRRKRLRPGIEECARRVGWNARAGCRSGDVWMRAEAGALPWERPSAPSCHSYCRGWRAVKIV